MDVKYDVVVVGAGPAGAISARYAARNGARTMLIEEHPSIGSPVQCTGLISKAALAECGLGEESFVLAKMRGAFVYAPGGEELPVQGEGIKAYVVDRKMFDRTLVGLSLDEGADILLKTRFVKMGKGKISVKSNGEKKEIQAGIIIGADGIQSKVARSAGLPMCEKILSGIQFEAPYNAKDPEFVEVFTGNDFAPGFFAWAVPFNGLARIGLAKNPGNAPPLYCLGKLLRQPLIASRYGGSFTELVVGGIPLGPPFKTAKDGVILVGDAAGQVKPTSGGGIYMGAVCAKIAGEVGARVSRGEAELEEYEKRWRSAVGRELSIGMRIHKSLGKLSDENLNDLIAYFNQPGIRDAISKYGDMDRPSVLLQKLIRYGDKKMLVRLLGIAFKTLF